MALFEKETGKKLWEKAKSGAGSAVDFTKKTAGKVSATMKQKSEARQLRQEEAEACKAACPGAIARYAVCYRGGLAQYPTEKKGEIGLNIMPGGFYLKGTVGVKEWFTDFSILYDRIRNFRIIKRQAAVWELALSTVNINARDGETENVLEITYEDQGQERVLRLEMKTGTNVYSQAKKCQELLDLLRNEQILKRICPEENRTPQPQFSAADELKKFKELLDMGAITPEEYEFKKKQLLGM